MAETVAEKPPTDAPARGQAPGRTSRVPVLRAVPGALAALLAVCVVLGLCWALIIPPWQAPDEDSHFAYAQSLAERFALPTPTRRLGWSDDQSLAENASHAYQEAHYSSMMRFDWTPSDYTGYLKATSRHLPSPSDGGGPNSAAPNPPLYYLYADLGYWADVGGNAFDRLYAMRIWGISLLALTVLGGWLLAGEVFERNCLAQLTCAATVGLIPMETSTAASVNPDALLVTLWTFALWLGVRVIKRPGGFADALALCAVAAAGVLTKATSYTLIPAVILALVISWRRSPPELRKAVARRLALAGLALVTPVLAWLGAAHALHRQAVNSISSPAGVRPGPFLPRELLSYIWKFYLPKLPFQKPGRTTIGLAVYDIWLREGWGTFGWLEIGLPSWVYALLTGITAVVGVASAVVVATFRDRLRLALLAFFAAALIGLLFGLHLTDYRSIIAGAGPILQGRYLLPVIGLFGLAVALVITRLPARWRGPACGVVVAGLLLLQVLALATVTQRYYT